MEIKASYVDIDEGSIVLQVKKRIRQTLFNLEDSFIDEMTDSVVNKILEEVKLKVTKVISDEAYSNKLKYYEAQLVRAEVILLDCHETEQRIKKIEKQKESDAKKAKRLLQLCDELTEDDLIKKGKKKLK